VAGRGWAGISNGELLRRMEGQYDVLVTMDRGIEFQQNLATFFVGAYYLSGLPPTAWSISSRSYTQFSTPSPR
jgi:hypothetical protein